MPSIDCRRPAKLYRYSERRLLERALTLGEFCLQPAADPTILQFKSIASRAAANYLTLSLAQTWDERLFDAFPGADCCLIVRDAEAFGERIHRAAQQALPSWAGIDAAISYGTPSPLGAAFSKSKRHVREQEWLFAWRPTQTALAAHPVVIQIGSIEDIAELRMKTP